MGSDEQSSRPLPAHDDFSLIAPAGQKNRKNLPSLQAWVMLDIVHLQPNTEPKPRRQVMKHDSIFIGMDVHKNSIAYPRHRMESPTATLFTLPASLGQGKNATSRCNRYSQRAVCLHLGNCQSSRGADHFVGIKYQSTINP
jgi:hypothetical protein